MGQHFLRRGDILLMRGNGKVGRLIRWGQKQGKYAPAVNHCALVVRDGEPASEPHAVIVEGADKVRRVKLFEKHADDYVWCYRPLMVPPQQLECIVRTIEHQVGTPYGYFELLTKLIDNKVFKGRIVARWLTRPLWGSNCDGVIAEWFERAGYPIAGRPGWACTPADIEALILSSKGEFALTFNGKLREYAA